MAIAPVDINNTSALLQASGMFSRKAGEGEDSGAKSWAAAARAEGVKPQTTQPLKPAEGVGGVTGPTGVLEGNSEAAIASVGANGMRAYDTQMWTNQPMAVGTYHNGQQTGVVGGTLRVLS